MTNRKSHTFFYHITIQYKAIFWVMIFSTLIGIAPFHLLLSLWSDVIAWSVTVPSIVLLLFLMYDYAEIKSKPILLSSKALTVHRGAINHVYIPLEIIKDIHTSMTEEEDEAYKSVALLIEKNIYIDLLEPVTIKSIFRSTKSDKIAFYVYEQHVFIKQLKEYTHGV